MGARPLLNTCGRRSQSAGSTRTIGKSVHGACDGASWVSTTTGDAAGTDRARLWCLATRTAEPAGSDEDNSSEGSREGIVRDISCKKGRMQHDSGHT